MASKINVDKIARGSGTPEFTIPTADGSAGQFLKTDGSGVLSFDSVTTTALTGSTNTWIPSITGANALTGTANFTYDGNTLDVKNSGTASSINLYCETGNAHYTKIKSGPHSGATSYTLTLPNAPPTTSGQVLSATTAGVASWAAAGKIKQVTSASVNTEIRTTSTSFVASGMIATLPNPIAAGSLVAMWLSGGTMLTGSWTAKTYTTFYYSFAGGAYTVTSSDPMEYVVWAGTGSTVEGIPHSMNYLLNPGGAGTVAIQPYFKASSGDNQYFNEAGYRATMIVMEIGA